MTNFFLVFALIGTTLIVVESTLFKPIRKFWPDFLECSQCVGMWVGAAAGLSGIVRLGYNRCLDAFIVGAATSFLSLLASGILIVLLGEPDEGNAHAKKAEESEEQKRAL